ncbi:MAG: MG2 domain-containing protein [Akkermansia muciniphila]
MNKKLLMTALAAVGIGSLPSGAGEISVHPSGSDVVVRFPEPVVSKTIADRRYRSNDDKGPLSDADLGLDLFTVTGDPEHCPIVRWVDQNRLSIRFPEGTDSETEYTLRFKPGTTYLGGAPIKQQDIRFRQGPSHLQLRPLNAAVPSVLVSPVDFRSAQSRSFSTASGLEYSFVPVTRVMRREVKGTPIPAKVEPARLKHGVNDDRLELMQEQKVDFAALNEESELPGAVLLTPAKALEKGVTYRICAKGKSGEHRWSTVEQDHMYPAELSTELFQSFGITEAGTPEMFLHIAFSEPMDSRKLRELFGSIEFTCAGATAQTAEDGVSKTLNTNDGNITFSLVEPKEEEKPQQNNREGVAYEPPHQTSHLTVKVTGKADNKQVDVTVKAGTASVLGFATASNHVHRVILSPAMPEISLVNSDMLRLYPGGPHKLRLKDSINVAGLEATAYRVDADDFVTSRETILNYVRRNNDMEVYNAAYTRALLKKREAAGMQISPEMRKNYMRVEKDTEYAKLRRTFEKVLKRAQAYAPVAVPVAENPQDGLCRISRDLQVDLDAAAGGNLKPGFYILKLQPTLSQPAVQLLGELGLPQKPEPFYALVNVSDLIGVCGQRAGVALVCSATSGKPLAEGAVTRYIAEEYSGRYGYATPELLDSSAVKDGLAELPAIPQKKRGRITTLLQCGEDAALAADREETYYHRRNSEEIENAIYMQSDRDLYRPGDTVRFFGLVRRTEDGVLHIAADGSIAKLEVERPNGEQLLQRDVPVDEFGTFSFEFELPKGEEDVTGDYDVTFSAGDSTICEEVSAEVFRRDSMEAETGLTVQRIAPGESTYTIRAKDLSGVAIGNARAFLTINSDVKLNIPGAKDVTGQEGNSPEDGMVYIRLPQRIENQYSYTLTAPLNQAGELDLKFTPLVEQPHNGHSVSIRAELRNDREEVLRLQPKSERFYSADFRANVSMKDSGGVRPLNLDEQQKSALSIYLSSVEAQPSRREQKVHVKVSGTESTTKYLPNGFSITTCKDSVLLEQDVTATVFDSTDRDATPTEIALPDKQNFSDLRVELTGTDAAGRAMRLEENLHPMWRYYREPEEKLPEPEIRELAYTGETAAPRPGTQRDLAAVERGVRAKVLARAAGTAFLVRNGGSGLKVEPREFAEGETTVSLPLALADEGEVVLQVLQPIKDATGFYTDFAGDTESVSVPRLSKTLGLQLSLPGSSVLPGADVHVEGLVCAPNGAPASAEVMLYAVDKGMLSVSGSSTKAPNPVSYFYGHPDYPTVNVSYRRPTVPARAVGDMLPALNVMPNVWMGQLVSNPDITYLLSPHHSGSITGRMYRRSARMLGMVQNCYAMQEADDCDMAVAKACPCEPEGLCASGKGAGRAEAKDDIAYECDAPEDEESEAIEEGTATPKPRLRTNFEPVAVWKAWVKTDADGHFAVDFKVPDTLTTYSVFACAADAGGACFGSQTGELLVNRPVMLTPGTPLFMSVGDTLRLPVTIANNTEEEATWRVTLEGCDTPQEIRLAPGVAGTVYFDYTAAAEGETKLNWVAEGKPGQDAVQGSFNVRFPAPLLKEAHRLVLEDGKSLDAVSLIAPELVGTPRAEMEVVFSANPLLHLAGCADYALGYPYGCTEQTATGLLPWLLYDRLAPFCPKLAETPQQKVVEVVNDAIKRLAERQRPDGGLSYWGDGRESCFWATAHAAMVLTMAKEQGYTLPEGLMPGIRSYLKKEYERLLELEKKEKYLWSTSTLYALGRALGDRDIMLRALSQKGDEADWFCRSVLPELRLLRALLTEPAKRHEAFLMWMRSHGHDYRHNTTWQSGWAMIALYEYVQSMPKDAGSASIALPDGSVVTLNNGATSFRFSGTLREVKAAYKVASGTAYATVKVKATPEKSDYPGVTEKGLQITRLYEKKDADGVWRPASSYQVGDVVRVTLTCAKVADELRYFVLEDYLPSCMEAINPNVPSQAAGLEWSPWSFWFDHREFLPDRVRGFCTKWCGRDLLNMRYYARVKRAGTSMAPPAEAQLMYEPQTYGLSPNTRIESH